MDLATGHRLLGQFDLKVQDVCIFGSEVWELFEDAARPTGQHLMLDTFEDPRP